MNAWVTGANGFIGRHLVRVLADRGYRVHGIGHGTIGDAESRRIGLAHWLNGEIDAANLNALAAHSGLPSTIFHLAGGSSVGLSIAQPFEDFSRTVASTARLLEWLRGTARDCRVIVASSAAVYGAGHAGAIAVDAATLPMSPYGQHKLMMEQLCRSYAVTFGLRSTVARLFSVYGPNLRKQLPWDICSRLQAGESSLVLGGTGSEVRDWTDVRDVARLLLAIDGKPQSEAFQVLNAGSGQGRTVAQIATRMAQCWGGPASVQFSGIVRAGDPTSLLSDNAMLRSLPFDWTIPVEQGLADYVSWFKGQVR